MTATDTTLKLAAMARAALKLCRDCRRDGFPLSAAAHLAAARDYRTSARRCRRILESATGQEVKP